MSKVHLIFGPQGADKTTYAKRLAEELNAVHFSIDDWMWKLFGNDLPKSMDPAWITERVERCEDQIWSTAKQVSKCGNEVILDLGLTKLAKRNLFRRLAEGQGAPLQMRYVAAPHALRRARVSARNEEKGDTYAFEVTPGMFDFTEAELNAPTESELGEAIVIDMSLS